MSEVVFDSVTISNTLSHVERVILESRNHAQQIIDQYEDLDSFETLKKSMDLPELYGKTADDYSKLCFLLQGASDMNIDLRRIKRMVVSNDSGLPPSMVKSYKLRVEYMMELVADFKESVQYGKQGMEARTRYLSSMTYQSYDKISGAKC